MFKLIQAQEEVAVDLITQLSSLQRSVSSNCSSTISSSSGSSGSEGNLRVDEESAVLKRALTDPSRFVTQPLWKFLWKILYTKSIFSCRYTSTKPAKTGANYCETKGKDLCLFYTLLQCKSFLLFFFRYCRS